MVCASYLSRSLILLLLLLLLDFEQEEVPRPERCALG